ncbi:AraC family transcriptional regulator [Streptomyces sp. 4N509B]|uniref:AraC family transcriptional regulator n=1 Tax=Streptomyces sp. 4N509B TaxID=3457413 RepID=UPI003FD10530
MVVTEFSTESVPASDRFALFEEHARRLHMPTLLRSDQEDDFRAAMRVARLGEIQLSTHTFPCLDVARTPRLVRESDPEVYQLNRVLAGGGHLAVDGRETAFRAGDALLLDSGSPWRGRSVAVVAAAHGISVRQLYRLFATSGTTPAAWIRERRLEHCRRDLTDPRLHGRSVHSIALRWGFTDPSRFSRLFRITFGMSARDDRQRALRTGRDAPARETSRSRTSDGPLVRRPSEHGQVPPGPRAPSSACRREGPGLRSAP